MKLLGQTLLAAAAAGAALWYANSARSAGGGMDSHRLPNFLEAALPPHHRATGAVVGCVREQQQRAG